jgi:hypothetical protein
MVSVAALLLDPAANVWGVKVAVAPGGRPLAESAVAEGKVAPRVGVTIKLTVNEPPGKTPGGVRVPTGNEAVIVKSSTFSISGELATLIKLASPLYTTLMERPPNMRFDVMYVAAPAVRGTVLRSVCPSTKLTDPVGMLAVEVTLAVKVTGLPRKIGFIEDARVTVGCPWLTGKETLPLTG